MVQCEARGRVQRARAGTVVLMRRVRDKANDETQNKCTSVIRAEAVALVRLVKYVPRRGCDRNLI